MSQEFQLALLTLLVGAAVSILVAAIPVAFLFHGRLARIEIFMRQHAKLERRVRALELGQVYLEDEDEDDEDFV